MFQNKVLFLGIILISLSSHLHAKPLDIETLSGSWHLRVLDGNEVRKARAILDFNAKKMLLSGFDGCNQITGILVKDVHNHFSAKLRTTKMACRQKIHRYVSHRLQETVKSGFTVKEDKKYGVEGITVKSEKHELFFKRMEKASKKSKWF